MYIKVKNHNPDKLLTPSSSWYIPLVNSIINKLTPTLVPPGRRGHTTGPSEQHSKETSCKGWTTSSGGREMDGAGQQADQLWRDKICIQVKEIGRERTTR